jgi:hypothetical protein
MATHSIADLSRHFSHIEKEITAFMAEDLPIIIAEEWVKLMDRNFQKEAWVQSGIAIPWKPRREPDISSPILQRRGNLRKAIRARTRPSGSDDASNLITIGINLKDHPQAQILNEGGVIKVTDKMRNFFWAKYFKYSKSKNSKQSGKAAFWRALALAKQITIPKRKYIGYNADLFPIIEHEVKLRLDRIIVQTTA